MMALISSLLLAASIGQADLSPVFPPGVEAVADRPNVFQTRTYTPTALPKFEDVKSQLPEPVMQAHPEWIRMYWAAWKLAFAHLKQPEPGSGFVSNFIDPAFNANTFQWDTCFMVQFMRYAEPAFHAVGSLDNFYAKQHPDGYICREIVRKTGEDFVAGTLDDTINPPLFAWTEWNYFVQTGDQSRLKDVLPRLVKYYGWIKQHRRRSNGLYWNTGLGSGEDDLQRASTAYSWVDMSSQQAHSALCISKIAEAAGEPETATYFENEGKTLGELVNKLMWDKRTGFYYDLDQKGAFTGIKTVLGFWPMMAHIAGRLQLAGMYKHLTDPEEFDRPDPVPALSADESEYSADGQYWNGAVWAPTNFMVVKGLQDFGAENDAESISSRYLANMSKAFETTGTIWENYAPESATGHGVRDMVGWSGLGPIALLIENNIGIRISQPENKVVWRLRMSGSLGLKNMTMGATHFSLLASKMVFGRRVIDVTSDHDFNLEVNTNDREPTVFQVKAGSNEFSVDAPFAFTMSYPTNSAADAAYDVSIRRPATATSSLSMDYGPAMAFDGNARTAWTPSGVLPQSLTVDLGTKRTVMAVDVVWGPSYAMAYSIESSMDGKKWASKFDQDAGAGSAERIDFHAAPFAARYVRLRCKSGDGVHKMISVNEMHVLGR